MKIVCPDGTAEIRELMTPESENKLEALGTLAWFNDRAETMTARKHPRAIYSESRMLTESF